MLYSILALTNCCFLYSFLLIQVQYQEPGEVLGGRDLEEGEVAYVRRMEPGEVDMTNPHIRISQQSKDSDATIEVTYSPRTLAATQARHRRATGVVDLTNAGDDEDGDSSIEEGEVHFDPTQARYYPYSDDESESDDGELYLPHNGPLHPHPAMAPGEVITLSDSDEEEEPVAGEKDGGTPSSDKVPADPVEGQDNVSESGDKQEDEPTAAPCDQDKADTDKTATSDPSTPENGKDSSEEVDKDDKSNCGDRVDSDPRGGGDDINVPDKDTSNADTPKSQVEASKSNGEVTSV